MERVRRKDLHSRAQVLHVLPVEIQLNPLIKFCIQNQQHFTGHPRVAGLQSLHAVVLFHRNMVAPLVLLRRDIVVLVDHLPEEIGEDSLISRHLGVAREVVDVNDEIAVTDADVPDHVEVEELQAQRAAEAGRNLVDECGGRHDGVLEALLAVVLLGGALVGEVGDLGEGDGSLGGGVVLGGHVGQAAALDAGDVGADDVDLEDDAAVVDELLEHERRAELGEALAVVDEGHLVGLGGAVGDEGLGDEREAERGEEARVGERGGVVDDDLAGDSEGAVLVGGVVEVGDDLEHGDAVVEAVDGVGRVDDGHGRVARGEGLELGAPVVAVELVDEEVEGALLRQGPRRIHGDEVHAPRRRAGYQRRLDEALLLLRRQRVPDGVARPVAGGGLDGGGSGGGVGGHGGRVGLGRDRFDGDRNLLELDGDG
ncbi:unnamed protein product [Urochloa decumbens]|uniref:Uncharacterized protein n=1 Tax=Urochloa decumbens TaxID=240449 RepID=A0ABC8YDY4_9POAL